MYIRSMYRAMPSFSHFRDAWPELDLQYYNEVINYEDVKLNVVKESVRKVCVI